MVDQPCVAHRELGDAEEPRVEELRETAQLLLHGGLYLCGRRGVGEVVSD